MTLLLEIDYDCVVKEEAFLYAGWGVRDVRGPYLVADIGVVSIPNWLFDKKFPTTVKFCFSLSNRYQYQAIELVLTHNDNKYLKTINKNESVFLQIESVFFNKDAKSVDFVVFATSLNIKDFKVEIENIKDYVSIDKIALSRNLIPSKIRY